MYEAARVTSGDHGPGIVTSDVKCSSPEGDTYLLQIAFESRGDVISMYLDEVEVVHDS